MSLVLPLSLAAKFVGLTVSPPGRLDLSYEPSNIRWWLSRDGKFNLELKEKLDPKPEKNERRTQTDKRKNSFRAGLIPK
jgi:hypothetical protein